jgi:hypothetical protein
VDLEVADAEGLAEAIAMVAVEVVVTLAAGLAEDRAVAGLVGIGNRHCEYWAEVFCRGMRF